MSSPLAQEPQVNWPYRKPECRIRQVYSRDNNFGLIRFDLDSAEPSLSFNLYNTRGQSAWKPLTLKASQLKNGVRSWDVSMDDASRKRHTAD